MHKWQYENDITPSTITITDTVNQEWVMRITPERKIEINEGVEITEAAQKVFVVLQELMNKQRSWQSLSDDEIEKLGCELSNVAGEFVGLDDWITFARAVEQALKEKNT